MRDGRNREIGTDVELLLLHELVEQQPTSGVVRVREVVFLVEKQFQVAG